MVALLAVAPALPASASPPAPTGLTVLAKTGDRATFVWNPVDFPDVSYRILIGDSAGVHPAQTSWNGREAALTMTTDDGFADNLVWSRACEASGFKFTAFIVPSKVGVPSYLSADDVRSLHAAGHEIASHSMTHRVMTTDAAFKLRYVGAADSCLVMILPGYLLVSLEDELPGFSIPLLDSSFRYLDQVAAYLDSLPDYECQFEGYAFHGVPTESRYLDAILYPGKRIDDEEGLLFTTAQGLDDSELFWEVNASRDALEAMLADSAYVCRTFAYPLHMHDQREMNAVMNAGYIAARDGGPGPHPTGAPVFGEGLNHVGLYEKPVGCFELIAAGTEEETRAATRDCLEHAKASHAWLIPPLLHQTADMDSAHLAWLVDEVMRDSLVWAAPFGEIAAYTRNYGIGVGNPVIPRQIPALCRVTVTGIDPAIPHYVVVVACDPWGDTSEWSNEVDVGAPPGGGGSTGVPAGTGRAIALTVSPNPTRGPSLFQFEIARAGSTKIAVFNTSGQPVRRLESPHAAPGKQTLAWDGLDADGDPASPGVYLYRVETPDGAHTGRLLVVH